MSDNPFQSPDSFERRMPTLDQNEFPFAHQHLRQIELIAILMCVEASFLLLYGLIAGGYAFIAEHVFLNFGGDMAHPKNASFRSVMFIAMLVQSGISIFLGILHIIAARFAFQLKHRWLSLFAVVAGVLSSLNCYCAPTSIGLCIFGLIALNRRSVVAAFEMRKRGMSKEEILARADGSIIDYSK